jgi:ribonuclease HI
MYKVKETLAKDVKEYRQETNPQKIWQEAKKAIKHIARTEMMKKNKKRQSKKEQLHIKIGKGIEKLNNEPMTRKQRQKVQDEVVKDKRQLSALNEERIVKLQESAKARYKMEGERNTKYWFGLNKERPQRETINALQNDKNEIKTETKEMTKIASKYHSDLQRRPEMDESREQAIRKMTDQIEKTLTNEQKNMMAEMTTIEDLEEALKQTKNGKSPGEDGLTYEFYKSWPRPRNEEEAKENPDIVRILTIVIQDTEEFGIYDKAFTKGVMALIYKKKEKTKIENYRPITLLNTDYKLQTKSIATKLGKVAKDLIHEDQAGFIPGRGLYDHTRTTHMTIEYCELMEKNGCIVSLDQEKAYDKIDHEYLWRVLEKNNFPEEFIKKIKNLYGQAETSVMVNGVVPKPIKIERGVRQGCPMSCLLYDLAIEPLAQAIRKSTLKGIKVKGTKEKLKVKLFADDTLVYLRESDNMKTLDNTIETFCKASTAKFNLEKSEYLPIGQKEYRKKVLETRTFGTNEKLEENLKIVKDGMPMRTLGAWVGNETHIYPQWQTILDKQKEVMDLWSRSHLPFKGKELVLKALVQSRALFLATVNGMPKDIMKTMQKQMKDFVWDGKAKGLMRWEEIIAKRKEGGLNIPDIEARLEAIQVMWLKKWLAPRSSRNIWASMVDEILMENIPPKPMIREENRVQWIKQSWNESMSKNAKVSTSIREMLKVGRKYNVAIDGPKMSHGTKIQLPIWHHFAAKDNYTWNKKASKCLSLKHEIKTVKDLQNFIEEGNPPENCDHPDKCLKIANTLMDKIPSKYNPNNSTPHKDNLDHTPRRIAKNQNKDITKSSVTFNPDVTERETIENAVRIFGKKQTYKKRGKRKTKGKTQTAPPAYREQKKKEKEAITLYTDGSCSQNGDENARTGAGIWHSNNSKHNQAIRLDGKTQTNQRAELMAVILALKTNSKDRQLKIKSDSRTTVEGIILRLKAWEDKDWLDIANVKEWKYLAYLLRRRRAKTKFKWVKAHDGEEGNEKADKEAKKGAEKQEKTKVKLKIGKRYRVEGARLQTLTQAQAYRLIVRSKKKSPGGQSHITSENIEQAKTEIEQATGKRPTEENLWTTLNDGDIDNRVADFIWKLIHQRLKCGKFFRYIEKLKERELCVCGETESPEHILFYCERSEVERLWGEVEKVWKQMSNIKWIKPNPGIVKGLGAVDIRHDGKKLIQTTKQYKTLVATTIWTIWKQRNRQIFEEQTTTLTMLTSAWKEAMIRKVQDEYAMIKLKPFKEQKLERKNFETRWCKNKTFEELINEKGKEELKINVM